MKPSFFIKWYTHIYFVSITLTVYLIEYLNVLKAVIPISSIVSLPAIPAALLPLFLRWPNSKHTIPMHITYFINIMNPMGVSYFFAIEKIYRLIAGALKNVSYHFLFNHFGYGKRIIIAISFIPMSLPIEWLFPSDIFSGFSVIFLLFGAIKGSF